jgi:hypothetical protein
MTNPANAMRMLVTYAICIPLAIFMGFTMTEVGDNPDYSSLFVVGLVIAVLASPILIKWHYPIMIFGMGLPMICFFLKGKPPLTEVVVILSLSISVVERTINSERRFIKAPVIVWPLLYTVAMVLFTAEMTGGIGLHSLGGNLGGGQKYLTLFIGIATFFALTSRVIPKEKRSLYIGLMYLAGLPAFLSDLFPFLPSPLNYINLLFPPSGAATSGDVSFGVTRLSAFAGSASVLISFMLVKYGLRGIFSALHPGRFVLFCLMFVMTMLGGFRIALIGYCELFLLLFFLEGLYRTRMLLVFAAGILLIGVVLVPFADKLPYTFQRALSFLPLNLDPAARLDAEGSKEWRESIWAATWPKVPQYLLLGKGYALHEEDYELMRGGSFEGLGANLDAGEQSLAISMDYHNGPLSTLMPFGIWGMISYLWVAAAALFILYRNYRYGDAQIQTLNNFLLAQGISSFFGYFFLFGAYANDIGGWARLAGVSIAFNWGIQKAAALKPAGNPVIRRLPARAGQPKILPA